MENEDDTFDKTINAIKPIHADTVHKICSGQVVFSLAVAVKELVENSLDAGATRIDIRFKNYGIDLIEVVDNGTGVTEENFSALTLKYHTSKLSDYSDLLGVSSFGFRGEALSSLCSLANVSITTRHQTAEHATKIVYDHNGHIINKTPCSRQVGTTVTLKNLFCSLPVRQKEFHKNVKREFNKMTNLLYAYCLISVGVNITCSNQTNSNSKSLVVTTQGDDLFIIDQHATDEIYNFEMLQRTTELTSQKLVIPQQLELSGVNEEILIDNLDVFKKNGFKFEINENGLPTRRVKLLTIPMSKNWIFGKDDIEELLFMLRENQSEHCRPSRVRAMFASRACRKSVMIGTALSKADMKTLVNHMADIDKPWNCPHGRPTIRHLVNLSMVYTK
ncbi:unnamed protein product, partial [Iphiclides podalirius]